MSSLEMKTFFQQLVNYSSLQMKTFFQQLVKARERAFSSACSVKKFLQ